MVVVELVGGGGGLWREDKCFHFVCVCASVGLLFDLSLVCFILMHVMVHMVCCTGSF